MPYPRLFHTHNSLKFGYETLNEALITSYDMNSCCRNLCSRFPNITDVSTVVRNPYHSLPRYKSVHPKNASFFINLAVTENLISDIKNISSTVSDSYGWFIICVSFNNLNFIDWDKDVNFICVDEGRFEGKSLEYVVSIIKPYGLRIWFEAKYTVSVVPDELYHMTEMSNISKIKKNGLVPRSYGNFPERIYFGRDVDEIKDFMSGRFKVPVMLRLNFDEFEDDIKEKYHFYTDPRSESAVFTYDVINPKYIQVNCNGTFVDLLDYEGVPVFDGTYSLEDKKFTVISLIKKGFDVFDLDHITFKKCLDYLGYTVNVVPDADDVKDGQGTDVTQCDFLNKRIYLYK